MVVLLRCTSPFAKTSSTISALLVAGPLLALSTLVGLECFPSTLNFHRWLRDIVLIILALGSLERVDSRRMGNYHKFLFLHLILVGDYRGEDIGFSMS